MVPFFLVDLSAHSDLVPPSSPSLAARSAQLASPGSGALPCPTHFCRRPPLSCPPSGFSLRLHRKTHDPPSVLRSSGSESALPRTHCCPCTRSNGLWMGPSAQQERNHRVHSPQSGQSGRAIVEGDHLCRCVAPPSSHRAASKERHRHLSACKIIMCFFTRCRGTPYW